MVVMDSIPGIAEHTNRLLTILTSLEEDLQEEVDKENEII